MQGEKHFLGILFLIFVFDIWLYATVFSFYFSKDVKAYFLSVGQGDATLLVLPGGKRLIIDGGPNARLISEVGAVLPPWARRIDAILVTHPEKDHFGGFVDLFNSYRIDYVFGNGGTNDTEVFRVFTEKRKEKNLNIAVLRAGDELEFAGAKMLVLHPSHNKEVVRAKKINDAGVVMRFSFAEKTILFTADVPKEKLHKIPSEYLSADILKVPHHGSKTGLDNALMEKIRPNVSVIEVGKNNYGHPKKEILDILLAHTNQIFRTDKERLKITITGSGLLRVDTF